MNLQKHSRAQRIWASLGILLCSASLHAELLPDPLDPALFLMDPDLFAQVEAESSSGASVIPPPAAGQSFRPVERVERDRFGIVGPAPLRRGDLEALVFPSATDEERDALILGLTFFTAPQPDDRRGVANQPNCLGCHTNSEEARRGQGLVDTNSPASRAARSTPTNFDVTGGDGTGFGVAADEDLVLHPRPFMDLSRSGRTASFTIFGDFCPGPDPCPRTPPLGPIAPGAFDGLARAPFFGFVQHTRPALPNSECGPDPLPPLPPQAGFRRAVADRAAPPYVGRGLMETIPNDDIEGLADPTDTLNHTSTLNDPAAFPECTGDCISGRPNRATTTQTISGGDPVLRLGRFGLRAQGPQLRVFDAVGSQEEVGITSRLRLADNIGPPGCLDSASDPEAPLATIFSLTSLIRTIPPPEFGRHLLGLLQSRDPASPGQSGPRAMVRRGAMLFGIDLRAFANRMIPGRMPAEGDGLDPHAINQADRMLNCVGCHTPIQRTGQSVAVPVGASHLSHVWAPIFSDMLLHNMAVIDAERIAPTPRQPLVIKRRGVETFDIPRNFGEDALPNQGLAQGDEFRTAPLMALGVIGPPFIHDTRVYLTQGTFQTAPAGTVMTDSRRTNVPLVVRTLDDAIRAAIELHDLPTPGAGCPVPPEGATQVGNVDYGATPGDVICPPFAGVTSETNRRSEAREVLQRYRALSPRDQRALIAFLKEL